MKSFILISISLVLCLPLWAQKHHDQENVKQTIIKMFELVEAGKSNELAAYIVYRGADKERKWQDYCRYDNPEEKIQVQSIHQQITDRYLPYKFEFGEFISQKESEGEWLVWEMNFFIEEDEPKKVYFAFLKVDGKYLLGDID